MLLWPTSESLGLLQKFVWYRWDMKKQSGRATGAVTITLQHIDLVKAY